VNIAIFIALFVLVYGVVFGAGISYIRHLIKKGPETKPVETPEALANRPISAALADKVHSSKSVAAAAQSAE
jgi:cytochrome d ubiquinol oxidase subunit I